MDSGKFWLGLWSLVAGVLVVLILSITVYHSNKVNKMAEMVGAGVSPLEASCALEDAYGKQPLCIILATKE